MPGPSMQSLSDLRQFVAESKGEWERIEFKKSTGELQGGMETLCGFLNPPAKRTLQDDLSLLRSLALIESGGRGAGARWWLKRSN